MFNYREEKKKFTKEWELLRDEYKSLNMSEEHIAELEEFDWEWFKSRRRYENRTQRIPSETFGFENDNSVLYQKYKSLSRI